ncbi:ABC transporter substrate-binding protein [Streptomyces roseirectus]|nr:ABC transporter substrate-binding protein [Streptomyces roseirectus]
MITLGALAPLTRPGWTDAGRHLLAGLELAVREVNDAGGIAGTPLGLIVRDTGADPAKAEAAVDELAGLGVAALAGEYHSVVARAAATRADALGVPFLCSSAVLDTLTPRPTDLVARLSPPQSRGWRTYADHLLAAGHRRIAVVAQPSAYWDAGTRVLRDHLTPRGAGLTVLDPAADVCDALVAHRATALLLLTGSPDPAVGIIRAVRRDDRLTGVLLGAPAGQPEFLGDDGTGIPFLRYLPDQLTPLGTRVEATLRHHLGEAPSFVAFEGYDTVLVLTESLRTATSWAHLSVPGTRGPITFSPDPATGLWQWPQAPLQVAEREPSGHVRVLRTG